MTSPTLRELVGRLPKPLLAMIPAYPRPDGQWRTLKTGRIIFEDEAADLILGYLVRWLLKRGWIILKSERHYLAESDHMVLSGYPTPLEAAVRAVGVISKESNDSASGTQTPSDPD